MANGGMLVQRIWDNMQLVSSCLGQIMNVVRNPEPLAEPGMARTEPAPGCVILRINPAAHRIESGWVPIENIPAEDQAVRRMAETCHAHNVLRITVVIFEPDGGRLALLISPLVAYWSQCEQHLGHKAGYVLLSDVVMPADEAGAQPAIEKPIAENDWFDHL